MPSISVDPNLQTQRKSAGGPPPKPSPDRRGKPRVAAGRVAHLPKREYAPRHRFGVIGFFFGFIGLIFRMVFVTLLVMGLVGWLGFMAVQMYVKTPEVMVPDVRGKKVLEAIASLSDMKLACYQERAEASALVAPGEIISQKPLPGTTTKEKTIVRVVVSSGRANYIVPDVVGETKENAINKIRGARLEIGNVTPWPDDKIEKDIVISQNPEANKGLDRPEKVELLISMGPQGTSLTMPDLSGKPVSEAKAALAKLGITDIVTDPPGSDIGTVTSQDPLVGKLILQTQKVVLTVNK